jgi:hypothetical protein
MGAAALRRGLDQADRAALETLSTTFGWCAEDFGPNALARSLEHRGLIEYEWVGYANRYRMRRTPLAEQLLGCAGRA